MTCTSPTWIHLTRLESGEISDMNVITMGVLVQAPISSNFRKFVFSFLDFCFLVYDS